MTTKSTTLPTQIDLAGIDRKSRLHTHELPTAANLFLIERFLVHLEVLHPLRYGLNEFVEAISHAANALEDVFEQTSCVRKAQATTLAQGILNIMVAARRVKHPIGQ
jgi:hypothetical protein